MLILEAIKPCEYVPFIFIGIMGVLFIFIYSREIISKMNERARKRKANRQNKGEAKSADTVPVNRLKEEKSAMRN